MTTKTSIPPIGYPHWLGPQYGAVRFIHHSRTMIQEGYNQHRSSLFKVPIGTNWSVIVAKDQLVEELHYIPDDTLSLLHAAKDELQIPHTMGSPIHDNPYHLPILRTKLTRHLDHLIRETMDEMLIALDYCLGKQCIESRAEIKTLDTFSDIVAQTFNRVLVGTQICRIKEYTAVSSKFAINTVITSNVLNILPSLMRPIVGPLITRLPRTVNDALKHLGPEIERRKQMMEEYGDKWQDKPLDVLTWLMESAEGPERDIKALATRVLVVNAATIHTSSHTFTQALYNLAVRPEYIEPLREEAEAAIRTYGWNRNAINKLVKMDSFFKESMRLNGLGSMGFPRKALKPFTFSDGTHIPEGTYVAAPFSVHFDEGFYPGAKTFDAFRFLAEHDAEETDKHENAGRPGMTHTSAHYLPFGHGKHACPGRFLVSYVLKALMAHVLLNYDFQMGGDGSRPSDQWFRYMCSPNRTATMFFKRKAAMA